jgi:DNA-binding CsgD family transcriptional regulator
MERAESSVVIYRPIHEVWDFMVSLENMPIWGPGAARASRIADEPVGLGARIRGTTNFLHTTAEWEGEITVFDCPNRLVLSSSESAVPFVADTILESGGGGTLLTKRYTFPEGFGPAMAPVPDDLAVTALERSLQAGLLNLADILDSGARRSLTARQLDVLRLVQDGLTNREIARELFISPKTAGHHVSAILTALHVSSRHELRRMATP